MVYGGIVGSIRTPADDLFNVLHDFLPSKLILEIPKRLKFKIEKDGF